MKFIPVGDRIVVTRDTKENMSAGGIHLPETAQDKPLSGTVIAIGAGGLTEMGNPKPMPFTIGQKVVFGKYAGVELKLDGQEVTVLGVSDVLCIIE
jgi:chaperonin GroES